MKKGLKHFFWLFSNEWGAVFGWPFLAPLHRMILNLSLHALGHDNPYHSGEEWFIKNILAGEDVQACLDVGANVGNYSSWLAEELNATVYSVEPLASSFAALEERAKLHAPRIVPIHAALSDSVGEAIISAKAPYAETATIDFTAALENHLQERVQVLTLDELVARENIQRIDFIKIDTEGFEREVARGMQKTLKDLRPKFVQFEFNIMQLRRGYTVLDMEQLLPGYTLWRLLPHGWLKVDPQAFAGNIFMFQNIVAVRSDIY